MPPHCPIRRCAGCGKLRPCVVVGGAPQCTECHPRTRTDDAGNVVATDGGGDV